MLWKLLVGALTGWVAGKIMHSRSGILWNILLGLVGGALGHWLAGLVGLSAVGLASFVISVAGACLLVWLMRQISGK